MHLESDDYKGLASYSMFQEKIYIHKKYLQIHILGWTFCDIFFDWKQGGSLTSSLRITKDRLMPNWCAAISPKVGWELPREYQLPWIKYSK